MAYILQSFMRRLDRFIDWFIPPQMQSDPELVQRARMFLLSHVCGPFLGNTIPIYLLLAGFPRDYRIGIFFASVTAFWVAPFVLRRFGHYRAIAFVSVQHLIFTVLWACYCYGGVNSPFLPWLLTVPLLAFFYLSWSGLLRVLLLGLVAANLVGFYVLHHVDHSFPPVELESLQTIGLVSTLAAAVYIAMMALYYAKILASQAQLEREVNEHMKTAATLQRTAEEAERAGAAKSDFVAKMSHELRTPLNAVIGYSQMLLEDAREEGSDSTVRDLEKIQNAGKQLLNLVNDVLDFSKTDAGKMEVFPEVVDIASAIMEAVNTYRPLIEENGNRLDVNLQRPLGTMIVDWRLASRAIGHLLENAGKFTKNGHVQVSVLRSRSAARETVSIEIADNGRGIPAAKLANLFDVFEAAEDASTSKYGGTGLGLPLSHKLCALLGGDLHVRSAVGVGTRFTIFLPTVPEEASRPDTTPDALAA